MEEDKKLYNDFINGNTNALEKIILKYQNNMIYFINRYVKNLEVAEDIFQDVIVYVLENKEKYNFNYSLKTYFYMIAKSLDYLKHRKYVENINEHDIYQEEQLLEEIIFSKERSIKIQNLINKMPLDYQLAIYLTQLDENSYKDTAKIMGKTERQIKTLVYNAKKKLRKLLIEEKIVEIKENKILKFTLLFIIMVTISTGIVYATVKIYETIIGQATLVPVFTGKIGDTDINRIWSSNFQIGWNKFRNDVVGNDISFVDKNSQMVNQLNQRKFAKDTISDNGIYIKVGKTCDELKNEILKDVNKKFGINNIENFDKINFESTGNGYTIYSLLYKKISFLKPFDRLTDEKFNNSEEKVKYFGINNASKDELNKNIEILFYFNEEEFGIKMFTNSNDEIILYRINSNESFEKIFEKCNENTKKYANEKRTFGKNDTLRIPYININTLINYDELCGHIIEENKKIYITNALQNIKFIFNEQGINLLSEANIKEEPFLEFEEGRNFNYNNTFVIFIKEKEKAYPYFALKVDNEDILEKVENS